MIRRTDDGAQPTSVSGHRSSRSGGSDDDRRWATGGGSHARSQAPAVAGERVEVARPHHPGRQPHHDRLSRHRRHLARVPGLGQILLADRPSRGYEPDATGDYSRLHPGQRFRRRDHGRPLCRLRAGGSGREAATAVPIHRRQHRADAVPRVRGGRHDRAAPTGAGHADARAARCIPGRDGRADGPWCVRTVAFSTSPAGMSAQPRSPSWSWISTVSPRG